MLGSGGAATTKSTRLAWGVGGGETLAHATQAIIAAGSKGARRYRMTLLGQHLVHRGDRDRALAHGGSDPLGAAAADIPDREHARNAGFE